MIQNLEMEKIRTLVLLVSASRLLKFLKYNAIISSTESKLNRERCSYGIYSKEPLEQSVRVFSSLLIKPC